MSDQNYMKVKARNLLSGLSAEQEEKFLKLVSESIGEQRADGLLDKVQKGCKQWSQIAAWSWLPQEGEKKVLQESFQKVLQDQARLNNKEGSDKIAELLTAKQSQKSGLTLAQLYNQLTGLSDYVFEEELIELFYFKVDTTQPEGEIEINPPNNPGNKLFSSLLTYPPRPAEADFQTLEAWSRDTSDQWEPPEPYIPTGSL